MRGHWQEKTWGSWEQLKETGSTPKQYGSGWSGESTQGSLGVRRALLAVSSSPSQARLHAQQHAATDHLVWRGPHFGSDWCFSRC